MELPKFVVCHKVMAAKSKLPNKLRIEKQFTVIYSFPDHLLLPKHITYFLDKIFVITQICMNIAIFF